MESEPRAPAHATGAVEFVSVDEISDDVTFRLRDPGDVSALAASIGRVGQLVPVELRPLPAEVAPVPREEPAGEAAADPEDRFLAAVAPVPRWQVVSGFRRLAALRMLHRDRVLARVHAELCDKDAWALALTRPLLSEPWLSSELEALRETVRRVAPWAEELLDEAILRTPVPVSQREAFALFLEGLRQPSRPEAEAAAEGAEQEPETVELTPEELALRLAVRIGELNQELAVGWEVWSELPAERRREIVEQARYLAELFPFMARENE